MSYDKDPRVLPFAGDLEIQDKDWPTWSWNTLDPHIPNVNIRLQEDEGEFQEDYKVTWVPDHFGYSREEADRIFPDIKFPRWSDSIPIKQQIIDLDIENDKLTLNWPNGGGRYSLGNNGWDEHLGQQVYDKELEEYKGKSINLSNNEEFVYATWDSKKEKYLEEADYKMRYKPDVLQNAKNILGSAEPVHILILTVDSISRRLFYRKLPKTVDYLNSLSAEDFLLYDFKIHNVMGEYSAHNLMPMWFGDMPYKMFKETVYGDPFYEQSIWKYLSEKGFVTGFVMESCNNDYSRYIGENPHIDHIVQYFLCAALKYNDFQDNMTAQRCIGKENAHVYMYNYIKDFRSRYNDVNQWIYAHLSAAHENTGTVIETLDVDTVDFLQSYLAETTQKTMVLFMGDHGMRYGDWFKTLDGSHEHRLPFLFMLASRGLIESLPFSHDILSHNQMRLVSKYDFNLTLKHLANIPFLTDQRDIEEQYCDWKNSTSTRFEPVSLLYKKIPNYRTCADINIAPFWCSCLSFTDITNEPSLSPIIQTVIKEALFQLNEESYTSRQAPKGQYCQKVSIKELIQAWMLIGKEDYFKIKFTINQAENVVFEAVVVFTAVGYRAMNIAHAFTLNPHYMAGRKRLRVIYIRRVDSYAGKWEDVAKARRLPPDLWVCQNLDYLRNSFPAMLPSSI